VSLVKPKPPAPIESSTPDKEIKNALLK